MTNVLVLDIETTVQWSQKKDDTKWLIDGSPFNPLNKLVTVNWRKVVGKVIGEDNHSVFYHTEQPAPHSPDNLQAALDWADILVAHHAKFDAQWLTETGFTIPKRIYCTMLGEYVLARGVRTKLSLDASAKRHNITLKQGHLVEEYFGNRIGYEYMPIDIVLEYAGGDVLSCAELFLKQVALYSHEAHSGLVPVLRMMNEMLLTILAIEHNGICIDTAALEEIRVEYQIEYDHLTKELNTIAQSVLGDTPFNINSGGDLSAVVYSRVAADKDLHRQVFNIGVDANGRKKYPTRMPYKQFVTAYKATTKLCYKTVAKQCPDCGGKGTIQKIKKDGTPHKNRNKCKPCSARGYLLTPTKAIAGFGLTPQDTGYASIHGFTVAKDHIDNLIYKAEQVNNSDAVNFLNMHRRRNAVKVYLTTFVGGIFDNIRPDGLLHTSLNQATTNTARLSSTNPNFQNQPRGHTFPVRRAVISRFKGGKILESDYTSLEFVVAAELSQDSRAKARVLAQEDEHKQTASIILQKPQDSISKIERQDAKEFTFKPLYGGTGYGQPPHIAKYLDGYTTDIYPELGQWHKTLMDTALATNIITTPSGREYLFPHVARTKNGKVTFATQIVNYPVQGFATGDIVPMACIRAQNMLNDRPHLKSVIFLTVHDSIDVDVYPDEEDEVAELIRVAMTEVAEDILERYGYTMTLPLRIEQTIGPNWLDLEEI